MAWNRFGWLGSGGTGGGGDLSIHGSNMHDSTVPSNQDLNKYIRKNELDMSTITPPNGLYPDTNPKPLESIVHDLYTYTKSFDINPNLLYNSTGMMNMSGWVLDPRVINHRDQYILDDYSFFIITGNNLDIGFICKSCPVAGNTTYTFSGEFTAHGQVIRVSIGYQTQDQLNTTDSSREEILLEKKYTTTKTKETLTDTDWIYETKSFTTPENCVGLYVRVDHLDTTNSKECYIRRLKIEEGSTVTKWVPSLTDPYQNNIVIEGYNVNDFT